MPIELKIIAADQKEFENILSWFTSVPREVPASPMFQPKVVNNVEDQPMLEKMNKEEPDEKTETRVKELFKKKTYAVSEVSGEPVLFEKDQEIPDEFKLEYRVITKAEYEKAVEKNTDDRPEPKLEEVHKMIKKAVDNGERLTVKALFARFEAERLSELAPAHYREFMDGLEAVL